MSKMPEPIVLTDPLDIVFIRWVRTLPRESLPDLSMFLRAQAERWPARRAHIVAHRLGRTVTATREKARLLGLRWGRARRLPPAGTLAGEIEAARRERATAPLYRPGDRV